MSAEDEALAAQPITQVDIDAGKLRILAEQAAGTPEMAVRLGKFCSNGPGLWLRLKQAYDLGMPRDAWPQ